MPTAANEADFDDPKCQEEAMGFQWEGSVGGQSPMPKVKADSDPANARHFYFERNGGLFFERRAEFAAGETLVRFSSLTDWHGRTKNQEDHLDSPWWLNDARFIDLVNRGRAIGVPLLEMARRQLALPAAWSAGEVVLVVASPLVLLAAYSGRGLTAEVKDHRRIIAPEAPGLWIDQLYIPGLGRQPWLAHPRPSRALTWLTFLRMRTIADVERNGRF